ncbi:MAG: RNA polymerase sigma factor [Planctomycetota bacterium]
MMFHWCLARGYSPAIAEDAIHDVFASAMHARAAPSNPKAYLFSSLRRNLAKQKTLPLDRNFVLHEGRDDRTAQEIHDCLESLPPEQREVVVLKVWHSMTFEEISDCLECNANTVAGRWRYALEKLERLLA